MKNKTTDEPVYGINDYKTVSRTFTYGILLATVPLIFLYKAFLPDINAGALPTDGGEIQWQINGAEGILFSFVTLFGLIPKNFGDIILFVSLIAGSMMTIRYEKEKYGTIGIDRKFLLLTMKEAFFISLFINPVVAFASTGYIALPFAGGISSLPSLGEWIPILSKSAGAGFFEELLLRVLVLGGIAHILNRYVNKPLTVQTIAIISASFLFALIHYTGWFGLPQDVFTPASFLYRLLLGVVYGTLYVNRGFATTAWTHTFANIWVLAHVF